MKSPYCCALILAAALPIRATAEVSIDEITSYSGMCEASAAVPVQEQGFDAAFVVANDEDNILRVYGTDQEAPVEKDINDFLGLDHPSEENDKTDLEAATWIGDKIFWLASHSRSGRKGKLREQRHQFFATEVMDSGNLPEVKPVARAEGGLFEALSGIDDVGLRDSIMPNRDEDEDLRPEKKGLNIEGMAAGADGASVLIGLRNPLAPTTPEPAAIILRLGNPLDVVMAGSRPDLRVHARLDLGGRGIRSMEYAPEMGGYYVAAGPVADSGGDGRPAFALYRWSGRAGEAATPVAGFAEAVAGKGEELRDFHPEAMIVAPDGRRIRLLSDDGDACDEARPRFRAVEIRIE
ncbi:MAG TPA: DUF3616 domain-containing protein [Dehalococcoidia bacterium]|nr:DUF3616 domain-containing protein [Dehalococcoidia bacterium]